jgi:uracil-DNA glycosylase
MSPRPLSELVSPDWAEALQPVAATITAMGAFLRAELAAGGSICQPGECAARLQPAA